MVGTVGSNNNNTKSTVQTCFTWNVQWDNFCYELVLYKLNNIELNENCSHWGLLWLPARLTVDYSIQFSSMGLFWHGMENRRLQGRTRGWGSLLDSHHLHRQRGHWSSCCPSQLSTGECVFKGFQVGFIPLDHDLSFGVPCEGKQRVILVMVIFTAL